MSDYLAQVVRQRDHLQQQLAAVWNVNKLYAEQDAARRRELKAAEDELRERRARDERVRRLASDMRDWCSPHGIAIEYANRLQAAIDGPGVIATHTANHPAAEAAP